jgi:hypothetical protein
MAVPARKTAGRGSKIDKNTDRRTKTMTDEEIKEFNSATWMTEIVAANNAVFSVNAKAMELTAALDADIDVLEAAGASRISSSGIRSDGTMDKQAARAELDKLVRKIAGDAKTIKKSEPDFDNKFKFPREA